MRFKKDGSDLNPNATVTAGNASQLSDGAAAQVVMEEKLAQQKGIEALGIFKGFGEKKHRHGDHQGRATAAAATVITITTDTATATVATITTPISSP